MLRAVALRRQPLRNRPGGFVYNSAAEAEIQAEGSTGAGGAAWVDQAEGSIGDGGEAGEDQAAGSADDGDAEGQAEERFAGYVHDPMQNPEAVKDIIVDPDAVYGYSVNPDSVRLNAFKSLDLTDPAVVQELRSQRLAYHESMEELYQMMSDMTAEGKTAEEIARAVSTRRNEIRLEPYKDDPEGLVQGNR